jgi:hypothetical protein
MVASDGPTPWPVEDAVDYAVDKFAGELFLALALQGRLVLDAEQADRVIAELEATLRQVTDRVRQLQLWRQRSTLVTAARGCCVDQPVVDAAFADQVAPGQLERALRELPKYVEAFKVARKPSLPT